MENQNQNQNQYQQDNNVAVQQAVNQALDEQKKKKKKKRLIILAVIVGIIVIIAIAGSAGGGSDSSSGAQTTAGAASEATNSVAAQEKDKTEGEIGDYICTVKSAEKCKNWEGKNSIKITYNFTNNSSDAESFDVALKDEAYQDGIGLESSFLDGGSDELGWDVKVKPGTTKEVSKVYILRDDSTQIELEISELISFSDEKLTYTVDLDK